MARPQATNGQLRQAVREVLVMAPGWPHSDELLIRNVRELIPVKDFSDNDLLLSAEWNLGKGYVIARTSEDTDEREWHITREGIAKQQIS